MCVDTPEKEWRLQFTKAAFGVHEWARTTLKEQQSNLHKQVLSSRQQAVKFIAETVADSGLPSDLAVRRFTCEDEQHALKARLWHAKHVWEDCAQEGSQQE